MVFINDIDEAVTCVEIIKKFFADDTKMGQKMTSIVDKNLQQALDKLCEWSYKWGMEFNILSVR